MPAVPLSQLCYDVAYFILPHYVFHDLARLTDLCLNSPEAAGPFFYLLATQRRKLEPDLEDARRFRWHHGELGEGQEYFTLEYPPAPEVGLTAPAFVLAPYFSAIVRSDPMQYFILGQAPLGGTTLRCIEPDGTNCNLGPGPEPELEAFLAAIRESGG